MKMKQLPEINDNERKRIASRKIAATILAGFLTALICMPEPATAVQLSGDDVFVLDFIANGDGMTNLSNFPVAVYWKWDGVDTLGIRMESPTGSVGLGALWSFNIFCDGSSPGGLNSDGDNNTVNNISVGGAFTAASLGAYGVPVDAIEGTWVQPCSGGGFDPSQTAVYIQLSILGPSGPSDLYRMAEYLTDGGTYANAPDIFNPMDGSFCAVTNGTCALVTFSSVPSYSCDGFEPPMNLALLPGPFGGGEIGRTVKRNRVLPFKATLVDGDDNPVTDLIAPPVIDVSFDPTIGPTEDVTDEALTPGKRDDGNQFILAGDKWTFNLWTKNYTADGTYTVTMQSGDTDEYVIDPICKGVFVIDP